MNLKGFCTTRQNNKCIVKKRKKKTITVKSSSLAGKDFVFVHHLCMPTSKVECQGSSETQTKGIEMQGLHCHQSSKSCAFPNSSEQSSAGTRQSHHSKHPSSCSGSQHGMLTNTHAHATIQFFLKCSVYVMP